MGKVKGQFLGAKKSLNRSTLAELVKNFEGNCAWRIISPKQRFSLDVFKFLNKMVQDG